MTQVLELEAEPKQAEKFQAVPVSEELAKEARKWTERPEPPSPERRREARGERRPRVQFDLD